MYFDYGLDQRTEVLYNAGEDVSIDLANARRYSVHEFGNNSIIYSNYPVRMY